MRPTPDGYLKIESVNGAKGVIQYIEENYHPKYAPYHKIDLIDITYDGLPDYIKLLDWLKETGRNYPIRIHSMNSIGVANMRRIIEQNS